MAPRAVVLLLLVTVAALAGCTEKTIANYERSDGASDNELFTFLIDEGTDEVTLVFSTEGSPASPGTAILVVQPPNANSGAGFVYLKELSHGKRDEATLRGLQAGTYNAVIGYEDEYVGPAQVEIRAAGGATIPGLGGNFWDIFGSALAVLTLLGGVLLYRRQSSRLNREMDRIDETFRDLKDDPEQCRLELVDMHEDLRRQLVQRRLKESHYLILEKRLERYQAELDRLPRTRSGAAQDVEVPLELE